MLMRRAGEKLALCGTLVYNPAVLHELQMMLPYGMERGYSYDSQLRLFWRGKTDAFFPLAAPQ